VSLKRTRWQSRRGRIWKICKWNLARIWDI